MDDTLCIVGTVDHDSQALHHSSSRLDPDAKWAI